VRTSATATGDGVRFAVGSNSHFKIEIAHNFMYKHVRESHSLPSPPSWLTLEMMIAKSHLLSLEYGGGTRCGDDGGGGRAKGEEDVCVGGKGEMDEQVVTADVDNRVYAATAAAAAEQVRMLHTAQRVRIAKAAALFLERNGYFHTFTAQGGEGGSTGVIRGLWLGEALVHRGMTQEVLFPHGISEDGATRIAGGGGQVRASPWQTSGSKHVVLLQCERALLQHFARLCVLDLLRARHVKTATRLDASRLIRCVCVCMCVCMYVCMCVYIYTCGTVLLFLSVYRRIYMYGMNSSVCMGMCVCHTHV